VTSNRRRALGIAGAVVALTLAVSLVLLAADARAWRDSVRDDDVLFQLNPVRAAWAPAQRAPFGLGRSALGVGDDVELRRAIRLFQLARIPQAVIAESQQGPRPTQCHPICRPQSRRLFPPRVVTLPLDIEAVRVRARIVLAAVERSAPDVADRALAANLLGVLAFDEARSEPLNSAVLLRQSTDAFRRAISLDPQSVDAKTNLEILLRLSGPDGEIARQHVGIFGGTLDSPGSGSSRAGRGY
jgi:hypothetical protein